MMLNWKWNRRLVDPYSLACTACWNRFDPDQGPNLSAGRFGIDKTSLVRIPSGVRPKKVWKDVYLVLPVFLDVCAVDA